MTIYMFLISPQFDSFFGSLSSLNINILLLIATTQFNISSENLVTQACCKILAKCLVSLGTLNILERDSHSIGFFFKAII